MYFSWIPSFSGLIFSRRKYRDGGKITIYFLIWSCKQNIHLLVIAKQTSLHLTLPMKNDVILYQNTTTYIIGQYIHICFKMIEHVWTSSSVIILSSDHFHQIIGTNGTSHVCGLSYYCFPNIAQHVGLDCTQSILSLLICTSYITTETL